MKQNRAVAASRLARALRMLIVVAAAWAGEAVADTYIILSLIGDHVTIVGQGSQVGSHLDQNQSEVVPLVESQLDDFAARVAQLVQGLPDQGQLLSAHEGDVRPRRSAGRIGRQTALRVIGLQ